ncbi:MAG: hypothetical protein RIA63_12805, partial [Cyclobacteriaceae bacterium]
TKGSEIMFDKSLKFGWGYRVMKAEYVAGSLNINIEEAWSDYGLKKIAELETSLSENEKEFVGIELDVCPRLKLKTGKENNSFISKLDKETLLFFLTNEKSGRNGPAGYLYLFFFDDDNNISKHYKKSWIL